MMSCATGKQMAYNHYRQGELMKILIIAATHGNELLGTKLIGHIITKRPELLEYLDFIIGNPRAYAKRVRYIESDLNRSYSLGDNTYEQRRANEIERYITTMKPDLVLDMHTTTCAEPPIMIVKDTVNSTVRRYLRNCHIEKVLQVTTENDGAGITPKFVAYEVMSRAVKPALLEAICDDIQKYIDDTSSHATKQVYKMAGKLYKADVSAAQLKTFINFEAHPLGFVPIMVGERAYRQQTDYVGFKADLPDVLEISR